MKGRINKIFVVFLLACLMTTGSVDASSMEEIQQQQEETRTKKQEAESALADLKSTQSDIIDYAEEIDKKITAYQTDLDTMAKKRTETENLIASLQEELIEAKEEEESQYEIVKNHIQNAYENGNYTYLDALLSATDFSEVVNKTEYIEEVNRFDTAILTELIEIRKTIANKQALLDTSIEAIDDLEVKYEDEKEGLQLLYDGKQTQIDNFNESIEEVQALIEELDRQEASQDAKIAALETNQNGIFLSGDYSGTFVEYAGGSLAWPMPSSTNITSHFGPRKSPTAGASSYHRGVDIACPVGSNVISAAAGIVIFTGYMGSAGNAVIVDHGGGLTTCYYHLSQPIAAVGQTVSQGEVIALSGNTGVSTGPHLHFAVRVNGSYVNPLNYY